MKSSAMYLRKSLMWESSTRRQADFWKCSGIKSTTRNSNSWKWMKRWALTLTIQLMSKVSLWILNSPRKPSASPKNRSPNSNTSTSSSSSCNKTRRLRQPSNQKFHASTTWKIVSIIGLKPSSSLMTIIAALRKTSVWKKWTPNWPNPKSQQRQNTRWSAASSNSSWRSTKTRRKYREATSMWPAKTS